MADFIEMKFFTESFLTTLPVIFFTVALVVSLLFSFLREKLFPDYSLFEKLRVLIVAVILFRISYPLMLSVAQYFIWSSQEFTKLLLPPHQPISYFLVYIIGRFWIDQAIAIAVSLSFYVVLMLLKKYQPRFLSKEEILLGFLMALLVGWPNIVIFVPMVFLSAIAMSVINMTMLRVKYTGLYFPFLFAGLFTFVFGSTILALLGLTVLQV